MTHFQLSIPHLTFADFNHPAGLQKIDAAYLQYLQQHDSSLHEKLIHYRTRQLTQSNIEYSEFLIELAKTLEHFIGNLFQIDDAIAQLSARTVSHQPIMQFKKYFVLKRAKKELLQTPNWTFAELHIWLQEQLTHFPLHTPDQELQIALFAQHLLQTEANKEYIDRLVTWCVYVLQCHTGTEVQQTWASFTIPEKIEAEHLIKTNFDGQHHAYPQEKLRHRIDFNLTDARMNERHVADQVHYCIYCHDHEGDFCSKGFPQKKGDPAQGFKHNTQDVLLVGCPLEEKISEMHLLRRDGFVVAALAMIMVDNPMCPATGHRICNDCMKACIYQKHEPVNIPQIETRTLTDTLALPWGVEIYHLLCVWNPLRDQQWIMKPYNGLKSMIAGMGPAGFTLAHHLLMEGFAVLGFDGLRLEKCSEQLLTEPVYAFSDLQEKLSERIVSGFGGVAEYGITVRWDKNFLKLIYLTLCRRHTFQVYGSTRFGGTMTIKKAWALGFDHFTVAVGAGLPKALTIPGSLAPGMRQANDFLMALHLGNAAKSSSLNTFQIRLPALVIGGGLTGVDTATELQAYYLAQVERILTRYTALLEHHAEHELRAHFSSSALEILDEYLEHARILKQERHTAAIEKRLPDLQKWIRAWGGVTIVYRKSMQESPAYIHNHDELKHAFAEGIFYREHLEPEQALLDEHGYIRALECRSHQNNDRVLLNARSILVATGTRPNIAYEFEHKNTFERQHQHYHHYEFKNHELHSAHGVTHCKEKDFGAFTSHHHQHKYVSLIGDTHPIFHGNVVKAIASGLRTYPKILSLFNDRLHQQGNEHTYLQFKQEMEHLFNSHVVSITRIADNKLNLVIHAPLAASAFLAGQFYRIQNLESHAPIINHTSMQMEGLALTPYCVDQQQGHLHFTVIQHHLAAKLCDFLQAGDPISLMGPTGVRAKVSHEHESILIIGDQHAFSFAESYASELKNAGNHVSLFAYFDSVSELHRVDALTQVIDHIAWIGDAEEHPFSLRPQDRLLNMSVIEALQHLSKPFQLEDIDRVFVFGSSELLRTVQQHQLAWSTSIFPKNPKILGGVHGNMQCMLKGVCAQCLQWQIDPETGLRNKAVFACSWQDQPIELIDIDHIEERRVQNQVIETLNGLWLRQLKLIHF